MKAKHSIWKSKLAKTMFFTTVVLVVALFLGSAASAALKAVGTGDKNTQDNSYLCNLLGLPKGTLDVPHPQLSAASQPTTGLAPHSATFNKETKQSAALGGDRGYFYAFNAYDPNGMQDGPVTFDSDAVVNLIAPQPNWNFISGSDFDPDGNWYAVYYYGGLFSVNKDTGDMTEIAAIAPCDSLVYDSATSTWYVSSTNSGTDSLYTIDITTGTMTLVGPYGIGNTIISLMCDTSGNMYAYDVTFSGSSSLYSIDKTTGTATVIGSLGHTLCYAQEGKFDRNDGTLYFAAYDIGMGQSYLATVDPTTAALTIVNTFTPTGIEIDGFSVPYTLVQYDHDVGVKKIIAPASGNAGVITPTVTVKNYGLNDEYFPTEVTIAKKQYSDYLLQDFEGSFPPTGWTVQTVTGGSWERNDFWSTPRPNMAGTGYCADADVNMQGNPPMITLLTSPSMDLSTAPGAILDVDSYEYVYYYDILLIDVSIDGGNSWHNLYKVGSTYEYGTLHHVEKDMSAYAGNSDVRLRFGYIAEQADMYWQIDNVKVRSYNWNTEYDQQVYTSLGSGQTTNVTFPDWTPADLGVSENVNVEYKCDAQTLLVGDEHANNDFKEKLFTLHYGYFHDVAITSIPSPVSGLAQTQPVIVSLQNNGQNTENPSINVQIGKVATPQMLYFQDFSGGVLPSDWGTNEPNNWYVQYTNYAGGQTPELIFNYYPLFTGDGYVYTGPIDLSAYAAAQLTFKQDVNDFNGQYTLYVWESTDGGTTWSTVYTQAGGPYGPGTTTVALTGGSANTEIAFDYSGYSYNINYWYIDDVEIDSLPMTVEYDQTVTQTITPGQSLNVNLPDWTPADLPLSDINYVVTATATISTSQQTLGTYGFEDYVPGSGTSFPPTGYQTYDYDGMGYNWNGIQSSYYAHTGIGAMYTYNYYAEDDWFVSPQITVPAGGGAGFNCYATGWFGASQPLTLEFWFCPYGSDPATFLSTGTYLGSATVTGTYWAWQNYGVSTTSIAGQTGYFAIRDNTAANANDYIWVDDITYPDGSTQGFETTPGYFPSWTSYQIVGTDSYNMWDGSSYVSLPPYMYPHSGTYMAWYNSFDASSGDEARLQNNNPIDLSATGYSSLQGTFYMYHDNYYSTCADNVQFQVSTDGVNWNTLGTFDRYDANNPGWVQHAVDLSAYASDSTVYIGFLATSAYGSAMAIDDLALTGFVGAVDGNPGDNMLSKMITLSYVHDVGIDSVLPPAKEMKDVIWDNGPHTASAYSSQLDTQYPFNSQVADDFQFTNAMDVTSVSFDGMFWNGNAENPIDLNVIFYADDGSGTQPTGAGMPDPTPTALFVELHPGVTGTDNGDGTFNYNIVLNAPFTADAGVKYWFVAQWVGFYPPQWGICPSSTQQLNNAMQGFPMINYPYWTQTFVGDVAFKLMGAEHHQGGTYAPGTYSVSAIVKNFGVTYTESNIPVEAKITHVDNSTVIYDQTTTFAGPLTPGATGIVSFPDFTLANLSAWEGKYKIEVWTALPGDDHPSNDKKALTITMAIPDVIPPITNHTITGTYGLNNWYVSNVVITLTAIDPAPFGGKPASGVNHTYYKLHAADPWTEYTTPVTVSIDGNYALYYYSIDKAGNIEQTKGPFNFKMDKTAPTVDLTVTKQGSKWLLTATATDATSGIAKVEFYVDDVLVGNATAAPYTYLYKGKGKVAQAIAYDNAGNSAMSAQVNDLVMDSQQLLNPNVMQGQLSVQQQIILQK